MKTIVILLLPVFIFLSISLKAQVSINNDGSAPDNSAMLDVKSTNMGLLPPRVADTNAVSTPAEGLQVYDLSSHCMRYYNGTKWSECMGMWSCGDVLTDNRNAKIYATVQIGTQCWMAENLNMGGMINGSSDQTDNGTIEKYCYDNSTGNCDTYGGMYQWDEMMQYTTTPGVQGICPTGWHIPTDAEWTTLTDFLGGISVAGGKMKETGTAHWDSPNTGATDESGFTGLPGGDRNASSGSFSSLGDRGCWWASSEYSSSHAWYRYLRYYGDDVYRRNYGKETGFFVRCLKD